MYDCYRLGAVATVDVELQPFGRSITRGSYRGSANLVSHNLFFFFFLVVCGSKARQKVPPPKKKSPSNPEKQALRNLPSGYQEQRLWGFVGRSATQAESEQSVRDVVVRSMPSASSP